jgi:hypothetical protein
MQPACLACLRAERSLLSQSLGYPQPGDMDRGRALYYLFYDAYSSSISLLGDRGAGFGKRGHALLRVAETLSAYYSTHVHVCVQGKRALDEVSSEAFSWG